MTSPEKIKAVQELAARTREHERAIRDARPLDDGRPSWRLQQLRARDLALANMTEAEKAEYRKLEAEMQKDLDDYADGDWAK